MRLFIAIDVGPPIPEAVPSAPPHLTLRFLGEIAEERATGLVAALTETARATQPFDLTLEGVGAFPSAARPRVVWLGTTIGADRVVDLARRLATALERVGFPPDREDFVPHVTLFRVRSPEGRRRARELLDGTVAPPSVRTVHVRELVLKESTLAPEGAVHHTLREFPFGRSRVED